jgi:hypothetical protein
VTINLDRFKKELQDLLDQGRELLSDLQDEVDGKKVKKEEEPGSKFNRKYQDWFTKAIAVVKQLAVSRHEEFIELYSGDKKRKVIKEETFTISDWLRGLRSAKDYYNKKIFNDLAAVIMRFSNQLNILESALGRFESSLFDIKQFVQADLYDSETSVARDLHKKGFLRPAGVVIGVLLEKHLRQVCENHNVVIKKKDPTIAELNDGLKNADVIDVSVWRGIQRLGDLRNLCGHNKDREPTSDEVSELIDGVEKTIKTLF